MTGEKKDRNDIEFTFWNEPENERLGRTVAAVFAAELNPTMEQLSDFKTAVSEAVTNAIIHAYPTGKGKIFMHLARSQEAVFVHIRDEGVGISDVEKSMEPLYTTLESQERSGMGFTFMEAFADELKVESEPGKGTSVYLMKKMGGR